MLSDYGLRERKWGAFPALRKVLETKPRSNRYDGLTSVSDNIFAAFQRFLDIAASAKDHKADLFAAVRSDPQFAPAAIDDLLRLMSGLRGIREHLSNESEDLDKLCGEVYRAHMETR
jgi:hypothetical protein